YRSTLFIHVTPISAIYTQSLHDALPISGFGRTSAIETDINDQVFYSLCTDLGKTTVNKCLKFRQVPPGIIIEGSDCQHSCLVLLDRKSTRLNSSHVKISYAVFCLKKKKE